MMKLRKPISSPGRTSTNPPPLMKFLRNKSSSTRRRSSTRASPMFFRKKHTQISNIQQEPSSPKVTCIGQIKHKHSNKKNQTPNQNRNSFCQCLRTLKPTFLCNVLTKWVSFFRCGYCEKSRENNNNSSPKKVDETGSFSKYPVSSNVQLFSANLLTDVNKNEGGGVIKSPPKNAFLLTRCRSAPYRSTSLASKLCESSVEEEIKNLKIKKDDDEDVTNEGVISGDEELMVIKRIEGIKEKEMPLFLTRCKSESGRKWDKFLV